jgi:hypothetical protein
MNSSFDNTASQSDDTNSCIECLDFIVEQSDFIKTISSVTARVSPDEDVKHLAILNWSAADRMQAMANRLIQGK